MQSVDEMEEHYRNKINVTVGRDETITTLDIVQIKN